MNMIGTITCPVTKIVKYGGASSARANPNGAPHARHSPTTRRKPLKIWLFPQFGHWPSNPRPIAVISVGCCSVVAERGGCHCDGAMRCPLSENALRQTEYFMLHRNTISICLAAKVIALAGGVPNTRVYPGAEPYFLGAWGLFAEKAVDRGRRVALLAAQRRGAQGAWAHSTGKSALGSRAEVAAFFPRRLLWAHGLLFTRFCDRGGDPARSRRIGFFHREIGAGARGSW